MQDSSIDAIAGQDDYHIYYDDQDGDSIYDERYLRSVPSRSSSSVIKLILNTATTLLRRNSTGTEWIELKVVDYGAGNGRFHNVYMQAAQLLASHHIRLTVTAVDPCIQGFIAYSELLQASGFDNLASNEPQQRFFNQATYQIGVWRNDAANIQIRLVKNHPETNTAEEKRIIGMQHCGICMFGVLSHVRTREQRVAIMKNLSEMTVGSVLYSVPNYRNCFLEEQKALGNKFNGDIHYTRQQGKVCNFYHLFSKRELEQDLQQAELRSSTGVEACQLLDETILVRNRFLDTLDELCCTNMPAFMVEQFAKYFLVEVEKLQQTNVMLQPKI